MLLNIIKGPCNFDEIKTADGITHSTYKTTCYALGLLDGDKEWHEAINQASQWATAVKLRELFVIILMFCKISEPLQIWETQLATIVGRYITLSKKTPSIRGTNYDGSAAKKLHYSRN